MCKRRPLLAEHSSTYTLHPGSTKCQRYEKEGQVQTRNERVGRRSEVKIDNHLAVFMKPFSSVIEKSVDGIWVPG